MTTNQIVSQSDSLDEVQSYSKSLPNIVQLQQNVSFRNQIQFSVQNISTQENLFFEGIQPQEERKSSSPESLRPQNYPKKLTWTKLEDINRIQQKPMEVDESSLSQLADQQEDAIQRNLSMILQSEVNSVIGSVNPSPEQSNSDQSDQDEENLDRFDDDFSDSQSDGLEECNSQCNDPCTNQKHMERQAILNIIKSTLKENKFDSEASQKFYQTVLNKSKEQKLPMFMRQQKAQQFQQPNQDLKKKEDIQQDTQNQDQTVKEEKKQLKLDLNNTFTPSFDTNPEVYPLENQQKLRQFRLQEVAVVDLNPSIQQIPFRLNGKTVMGNFTKFPTLKLQTLCYFIDQVHELQMLDNIINIPSNDMVIAINVHMNADQLNKNLTQKDVFGPSILTIGYVHEIFIIDMMRLGQNPALDFKLTQVIRKSKGTFATFGVQALIDYFQQFYENYQFLRYIPRILDIRFMYWKIQRTKSQRSYSIIYQTLMAEKFNQSEQFSNWEQRPLSVGQLQQSGLEIQGLLRMVYKLSHLSNTKNSVKLRIPIICLVSTVADYIYCDNPLIQNEGDTRKKKNKNKNISLLTASIMTEFYQQMNFQHCQERFQQTQMYAVNMCQDESYFDQQFPGLGSNFMQNQMVSYAQFYENLHGGMNDEKQPIKLPEPTIAQIRSNQILDENTPVLVNIMPQKYQYPSQIDAALVQVPIQKIDQFKTPPKEELKLLDFDKIKPFTPTNLPKDNGLQPVQYCNPVQSDVDSSLKIPQRFGIPLVVQKDQPKPISLFNDRSIKFDKEKMGDPSEQKNAKNRQNGQNEIINLNIKTEQYIPALNADGTLPILNFSELHTQEIKKQKGTRSNKQKKKRQVQQFKQGSLSGSQVSETPPIGLKLDHSKIQKMQLTEKSERTEFEERIQRQALADKKRKIMEDMKMQTQEKQQLDF